MALLLCACDEEGISFPPENVHAVTTVTLIPDTINVDDCIEVQVKFQNLSEDTLRLTVHGTYHVYYSIEVNDTGSIWFPDNDTYDISTLIVSPGESIVKVVPFCPYRGGNTRWSMIDSDTLAPGMYMVHSGISATNHECCTIGSAMLSIR